MSATPLFPTQEIGSLAKPIWRLKAISKKRTIEDADVDQAISDGEKLGVDGLDELQDLLRTPEPTVDEKERIKRFSSVYGLKFLEASGLDWVYDGEQLRTEMYDEAMRNIQNAEKRGWVRSFDNRYYIKQAITGAPGIDEPYHLDEFEWIAKHASKPLKVPITGAYTLLDWSYDETLGDEGEWFGAGGRRRRAEARRELGVKIARDVIRPNVKALIDAGAKRIQIDEPAATTVPEEVPLFVETFNESVKGLTGDCEFSIHICFSDYSLLFPHILELDGCTEFAPEFANDDLWTRGAKDEDRPGYRTLDLFRDHDAPFRIGLGVTDIHTDRLETVGLIEDRIRHAVKTLGDESKVAVNPDCGLRTRSWKVAGAKLGRIAEATQNVRAEYGEETVPTAQP